MQTGMNKLSYKEMSGYQIDIAMNNHKINNDEIIATREVQIRNKMGLHARPATLLVDLANKFSSEITIHKGEQSVDAKSIMHVLQLAAGEGTNLTIKAQGKDAEEAVNAIAELIEKEKFNEE